MKKTALLFCALTAFAVLGKTPAPCLASENPSDSSEVVEVEAEGLAAIIVDPITARDRAIVDAKRKAVEQAAGVEVDAKALYSMGLSQEDWVRLRSFGYIKQYEITKETPGTDRYAVAIRAWVLPGGKASSETAKNFLSRRSFIVLSQGENAEPASGALKAALLEKGFSVYDEEFIRDSYVNAGLKPPDILDPGKIATLNLSERFLADYLIVVKAEISAAGEQFGIKVFQASVKIQLTEASSSLLKATAEGSNRIFGLTKDQAVSGQRRDQFRKAVVDPSVSKFFSELEKADIGSPRQLKVFLQTPSSQQAFERLALAMKEVRWVQSCEKSAYSEDRAVLLVDYPEKELYLAADVDFLPGYTVSSYGTGYVVVRED